MSEKREPKHLGYLTTKRNDEDIEHLRYKLTGGEHKAEEPS